MAFLDPGGTRLGAGAISSPPPLPSPIGGGGFSAPSYSAPSSYSQPSGGGYSSYSAPPQFFAAPGSAGRASAAWAQPSSQAFGGYPADTRAGGYPTFYGGSVSAGRYSFNPQTMLGGYQLPGVEQQRRRKREAGRGGLASAHAPAAARPRRGLEALMASARRGHYDPATSTWVADKPKPRPARKRRGPSRRAQGGGPCEGAGGPRRAHPAGASVAARASGHGAGAASAGGEGSDAARAGEAAGPGHRRVDPRRRPGSARVPGARLRPARRGQVRGSREGGAARVRPASARALQRHSLGPARLPGAERARRLERRRRREPDQARDRGHARIAVLDQGGDRRHRAGRAGR